MLFIIEKLSAQHRLQVILVSTSHVLRRKGERPCALLVAHKNDRRFVATTLIGILTELLVTVLLAGLRFSSARMQI